MQPLTDEAEIAQAFSTMEKTITEGGEPVACNVGYQGGSETVTLIWHDEINIWALLQSKRIDNRYWCAFGRDNPHHQSLVPITCEINPPRFGINRRCAGLFLRDINGIIYLAHSGKIGGGRKGIGKTSFLKSYNQEAMVRVTFPNGVEDDYIIIGRVNHRSLLVKLTEFIQNVATFKESATIYKTQ